MDYPYVPQALGFKAHTPSNNPIGEYATLYLTDTSILNVTDYFGHETNGIELDKGYHPLMFHKIRGVTGGTVYLCHNGKGTVSFLSGDNRSDI